MENTPSLANASDILKAYRTIAADETHLKQACEDDLIKDLAELFMSKPTREQMHCADIIELWLPETLLFVLPIVDACVAEKNFNAADRLLAKAYRHYSSDPEERRKVVEKGLSLVDACVAEKDFHAVVMLSRAYDYYPLGSEEQRMVVEKGLAIVDACVAEKRFDLADSLLARAQGYYPSGSNERRKITDKRIGIDEKRGLGESLGGTMDISLLKVALRQELSKVREKGSTGPNTVTN